MLDHHCHPYIPSTTVLGDTIYNAHVHMHTCMYRKLVSQASSLLKGAEITAVQGLYVGLTMIFSHVYVHEYTCTFMYVGCIQNWVLKVFQELYLL